MKEKWWQKWWVWVLATAVLLMVIQFLFQVHPKYKWLEAVWNPGDLLAFLGTVVLGYIAVYQTKKANDMTEQANQIAEQANKTSARLMDLQEAEYIPIITITDFVGLSYPNSKLTPVKDFLSSPHSDLVVHEMRTKTNEAIVGLSIVLVDPETKSELELYQRTYQLSIHYTGKPIVKKVRILSVSFLGIDYKKEFKIETSPDLSLNDGDEYPLFLLLVGNDNFTTESTSAYTYITSPMMQVDIELTTMQGKVFVETVVIHKHLIKKPEAKYNSENVEVDVSVSYDVQEKYVEKASSITHSKGLDKNNKL